MIPAICRPREVCPRGGLTDERRAFCEKVRLQAAEQFRQGDENTVIAHGVRVSVRSVQRWRRAWSQDGPRALASRGPASLPLHRLRRRVVVRARHRPLRAARLLLRGRQRTRRERDQTQTRAEVAAVDVLEGGVPQRDPKRVGAVGGRGEAEQHTVDAAFCAADRDWTPSVTRSAGFEAGARAETREHHPTVDLGASQTREQRTALLVNKASHAIKPHDSDPVHQSLTS
jgi:hypothetical protein